MKEESSFLIGTTDRDKDFRLPVSFTTETSAILARKGAGKTYTAQVEAEGLLGFGQQVVVIDPLDAWWGLRSSSTGRSAAFQIVIFGGEHGDLPLERQMGPAIASFVAENPRLSCVLSLRHLRKGDQYEFATHFAETLFHSKGRTKYATPMHLFVDEADRFAPQRVWKGAERMLGAAEDLVRRGRQAGIGVTMITQRPQSLNKDVLTQVEILTVGQITGPHDKRAVQAWIELNADDVKQKTFLESLAKMRRGHLWFWSPSWLRCMSLVKVKKKLTFDSSATPKPGMRPRSPKKTAKVDLNEIRKVLQTTIEEVKRNDPKELLKQIADLKRELGKKQQSRPAPTTKVVQAAAPSVDMSKVAGIVNEYLSARITAKFADTIAAMAAKGLPSPMVLKMIQALEEELKRPVVQAKLIQQSLPRGPRQSQPRQPVVPDRTSVSDVRSNVPDASLGRCERSILTVLVQRNRPCTKRLVALQAQYSLKSGGFNNSLSKLRSLAYIGAERGGAISITHTGRVALGPYDPLPIGYQLLEHWKRSLGKCERALLESIVNHHPDPVSKESIAVEAGYSATSGGFNNALSRLRGLELIEGRGEISLSGEVFDG